MNDRTYYKALDDDQLEALLQNRIMELEAEHYATCINIMEIEGVDSMYPDGDTEKARADLQKQVTTIAIRLSNLRKLERPKTSEVDDTNEK